MGHYPILGRLNTWLGSTETLNFTYIRKNFPFTFFNGTFSATDFENLPNLYTFSFFN